MYVQRNIWVRSRNHCCRGKATKYYIFWVCVSSSSYPTCNAHAQLLHCHLCSAPLYHIFPYYLI